MKCRLFYTHLSCCELILSKDKQPKAILLSIADKRKGGKKERRKGKRKEEKRKGWERNLLKRMSMVMLKIET